MSASDVTTIISIVIQTLAVLAAVGTAMVALHISKKDREGAQRIAEDDRKEALRQAHLMWELRTLQQLSENRNIGGSTSREEATRMGAAALTLVGLIGRDRIPIQFDRIAGANDVLRAAFVDPEMPDYKKDAIETQLAVNAVLAEIRESTTRL